MKFPLILVALLSATTCFAQQSFELAEDRPAALNGVEYGFAIRNERNRAVKDETFSRYEVTVYATNKSGCNKIMFPRQTTFGTQDQNLLAEFDCTNATGKRMTSKNGSIKAQPFTVPYRQTMKNAEGKDITTTTDVQAGHMLRNGETISMEFIVLIPEGERPRMKVRVREIQETF
ncbi:MAG: ABC transporter permease [Cytophagaceae bacterium]|nr:ABC transporter permease [Cytophagaceae bacterium]